MATQIAILCQIFVKKFLHISILCLGFMVDARNSDDSQTITVGYYISFWQLCLNTSFSDD